jgi:DNA-binding NarL/FixJ family response regulator
MSPIKLFICEDSDIIRHGLIAWAEQAEGFEIIGSCIDGESAVELIPRLAPDVVLMDISMPRMDGIEATRALKRFCPELKILILTSSDANETFWNAMDAGANGYCLKQTALPIMQNAILSVMSGACWLDAGVAVHAMFNVNSTVRQTAGARVIAESTPGFGLSPRQRQVLELIAEGLSNREIGVSLSVSAETVKTHVRHIMEKLEVSDRTQAALKALRAVG